MLGKRTERYITIFLSLFWVVNFGHSEYKTRLDSFLELEGTITEKISEIEENKDGDYGEGFATAVVPMLTRMKERVWSPMDSTLCPVGKIFPFEMDEGMGYVNRNGDVVITSQFDYAGQFVSGLAVVKLGTKYGYINKEGRYIINPQFDDAGHFSDGLAKVNMEDDDG